MRFFKQNLLRSLRLFSLGNKQNKKLSAMAAVDKEQVVNEAEVRRREAEKRTQDLIDACPLAVTLYDTEWTELSCNPASLKLFGVDETYEFGNKTDAFMQEIQPCGRHRDEVDAELHKSLMETGYAHAEIVCLKADGTPMILETDYVRLDYSDYSLFASYCRDLTEEKAIREREREKAALELAQQRMTAMLNASPLACFVLNASFEVLELNREAINLFGAKNKQDFIENFIRTAPEHQLDGETSIKKMSELMSSSEEYINIEWLAQTFQGEQFPCELHAMRFFNDGEKMVVVHMRDLRDFYAYQEMSERTQLMFDTAPIIMEYWDADYNLLDCNQTTLDYYGETDKPAYLAKKDDFNAWIPWNKMLMKTFDEGFVNTTIEDPQPDGSIIYLEVDAVRVIRQDLPVVVTYARDVTQLRKLQREQEELLQKLEAASEAKSRFLSNMSHEIRTPMSAIIGMTGIAKNTGDTVRKDDCIGKIEKASKHLLGIVNQILDISKIEAEQFKLDSRAFRFEKMVDELVSVLSVSIEEKQLVFEVNLDSAIPRFIVSDEVRLAQVFTNLLINAVKFTPEGGIITLTAKLVADDSSDENIMRVEVSDSGIGIPKEQQSHLFGDFMQLDSGAARKFGGTGLGLSISKQIVEMMGGSIWAVSEPGKGSRFIFTIPIQAGDVADEDSHIAYSDIRSEDVEPDLYKGYTTLVAEDMEINREIVSSLLEPTGIAVEYASDGAQTVQMFCDAPDLYDIIFMDVQMPGMDGITATRLIRELGTKKAKSVPIVAMTANVFQEDIDACLVAGMNDHLGKPLVLSQIMAKLQLYL